MAEIQDLNITDASNTARWPENMAPSAINNAGRADEGLLARWHKDTNASKASTGSANAYVFAADQTLSAYYDGLEIGFDANFANTGAATLNVDALGATTIKKNNDQDLASGDIEVGQKILVIYDGTNFQMVSPVAVAPGTVLWELIGTATPSASATVDFTWAGTVYKQVVVVFNALPATNNVGAWIRTSTNASTFDSGVSDYAWVSETRDMALTPTTNGFGDNADAQIELMSATLGIGNAANEGIWGIFEIVHPAETTFTTVKSEGAVADGVSLRRLFSAAGQRLSAADVDGVRFLFSSGNIASGEFSAYGLL